jgi:hypothetical protein
MHSRFCRGPGWRKDFFVKCELDHMWSGPPDSKVPEGHLNTLLTTTDPGVHFPKIRTIRSIPKQDNFATIALSDPGECDE